MTISTRLHPMPDSQEIPSPQTLADELERSYQRFWEIFGLLDEDEVEKNCLENEWSPKALLAHIAFWDDYQTRRMKAALSGESAQGGFARPPVDNDNRALEDAHRDWQTIVNEANAARQRMVDFARSLEPAVLEKEYAEGERTLSILKLLQHMVRHTHGHSSEILRFCGSMNRWQRPALRKLVDEQFANLMDSVAGMSEEEMLSSRVYGSEQNWSVRDLLVHVLAWSECCYECIRQWPQPDPATVQEWQPGEGEHVDDVNERLLSARAHLTMIEIADGIATYHRRLLNLFDQFSDADLSSHGRTWDGDGVLSSFYFEIALHTAEHAAEIWHYRAEAK